MCTKLLSQDNLFNIATIGIVFFATIVSALKKLDLPIWWITIITFVVLSVMNRVTFRDGKFFNSQEQDLSNRLPTNFGKWYSGALAIVVICGLLGIIPFGPGFNFGYIFTSWFCISLSYFIFINFPMSILLNYNAWTNAQSILGIKPASQDSKDNALFKHSRYSADDSARHNSPAYKYLPYNTHHHR